MILSDFRSYSEYTSVLRQTVLSLEYFILVAKLVKELGH